MLKGKGESSMANTSTAQQGMGLRGPFIQTGPTSQPASGEGARAEIRQDTAAIIHQLSRLEQIVEYLKVLYR
jgi:hypothetical protein